jgi:hypothetical protein
MPPVRSWLTTGGLCGNVDLYDACVRKHKYKGKFELTYVSNSQVSLVGDPKIEHAKSRGAERCQDWVER